MGDTALRDKVAALCAALAEAPPPPPTHTASGTGEWWPAELGRPSATGTQNGVRYACFPETRRVAIEQGGKLTIYDSGEHRITGVSQSPELSFTSAGGTVLARELAVAD